MVNATILGISKAHGKGRVYCKTLARSGPRLVEISTTGIIGILMGREVEDPGIFVKSALGAVAVVQVPVYDQDPLEAELLFCIFSGNRNVVKDAETHPAAWFSVVAGGTDEGEDGLRIVDFGLRIEKSINTVEQTAGGEPCDFVRPGGQPGVGIELGVEFSFSLRDSLYVEGVVDQCKFIFRSEPGRNEGKTPEFVLDQVMDHTQPVRTLGVALAGVVLQVAVVFKDGEG